MYTIRQIAEATGFSLDTLRYYEKLGLVEPARRGQSRVRAYGDDQVYALKVVKCLKETGLSLEAIKEFLQEGQNLEHGKCPQRDAEHSILKRIKLLSEHLERMEEQRRDLDQVIHQTRQKLHFYTELLQEDQQIPNR